MDYLHMKKSLLNKFQGDVKPPMTPFSFIFGARVCGDDSLYGRCQANIPKVESRAQYYSMHMEKRKVSLIKYSAHTTRT